ncbi:MAG: hypothetical protein K0R54_646 [Clostridiaceae bacterium]|nr:hypothetical protein [Clostridiaceae bacterium]
MLNIELEQLIEGKSLNEILLLLNDYEIDSAEWEFIDNKKAELLENENPEMKEEVIYFHEYSLIDLVEGFIELNQLPDFRYSINRRSVVEHNPEYRFPIPYIVIKYGRNYFFRINENNNNLRIGLFSRYVRKNNININSLNKTVLNALKKEIYESSGISDGMVVNLNFKGLIKANNDNNYNQLGVIYLIEISTDEVRIANEEKLQGIWIHENKLKDYYENFEPWTKLIYENIIKKHS